MVDTTAISLSPPGQCSFVGFAGIDPARTLLVRFLFPEWGAGLEKIHDEFASGECFAAMARRHRGQDDLIAAPQPEIGRAHV